MVDIDLDSSEEGDSSSGVVTNPYLLPFTLYLILILSYHIMWLIPWLDMWLCHMTSMMHSFIFLTCVLHVLNMCSTCVSLTSYSFLLSFMINTCLLHVAAQHMSTFHLPHVLHALTICLPGCCLEDSSIYSLLLYTCNLTSHCCPRPMPLDYSLNSSSSWTWH